MLKKLRLGGIALTSLLAVVSCQNEEVVSNEQQGYYSLNVSSLVNSRTSVEDDGKVVWSEGDKLYVYGKGVSGVLTVEKSSLEDGDASTGTFTGFVFGDPDDLKWAVYGDDIKSTADGVQFTIKSVSDPNSNSPMVGEITNGNVELDHLCGMVRITINNLPENADVKLTGTNIAGTAEVKEGVLQTPSYTNEIAIKVAKGNQTIEVPVFATTTENTVSFTLSVNGKTCDFSAPVKVKSLSQNGIKPITCISNTEGEVQELSIVTISNTEDLNTAINNSEITNIALPTGSFELSGTNEKVFVGSGEETVIDIQGNIQNVNISNATVTGAQSLNVKDGNTATFTNVVFEGGTIGGTSQGVVKGEITFVGCTFKSGIHIDSSTPTAIVKFIDCTFTETSVIKLGGGPNYLLEGCTVETISPSVTGWGTKWLISYSDITFTGCTLGRVIRAGAKITITLDDCVDAEGVAVTEDIVDTNSSPTIVIK